MWKKILIGITAVILGAGLLGWFNRTAIITHLVLNRAKANKMEVGPYQPINWQKGPETAATPLVERPPNIVFILLDDLGYNDISTFGGGVANGRVPTPNIDKLAADGAIYTQAYSGTGTCAPSRAMLMTGRYPTRTGFEFTPTPDGMSMVVSTIANSMRSGATPPTTFNREIDDVSERQDRRQGHTATDTLVHAKLDRMREVQQIWGQETRQNALKQVAAIMKRSVRKADAEKGTQGDIVDDIEGDGFTILVRGAEEKDASLIAKRLRSELARTPIEGLSDNIRLTASFGVASRRMGESLTAWRARAEEAVNAASAQGEDQIVEASVVEEMTLLPPPSPKANPKVA